MWCKVSCVRVTQLHDAEMDRGDSALFKKIILNFN